MSLSLGPILKRGLIAGLISGVLAAIFSYIIMVSFKDDVIKQLEPIAESISRSVEELYQITLYNGMIWNIVLMLFIGMILAILYSRIYHRIPGETSISKGLVLGFIFGIIFGATALVGGFTSLTIADLLSNIIVFSIYGIILGYMFRG